MTWPAATRSSQSSRQESALIGIPWAKSTRHTCGRWALARTDRIFRLLQLAAFSMPLHCLLHMSQIASLQHHAMLSVWPGALSGKWMLLLSPAGGRNKGARKACGL